MLVAVLLTAFAMPAAARDGVHNGGFELGRHPREDRPAHWLIGFPGDLGPLPGTWALVRDATSGSTALELVAASDDMTYLAVQILDLPASVLADHTLEVTARVRRTSGLNGWVGIQVAALNPEVDPDPISGIAHVGFLQLVADPTESWQNLSGHLTLGGPAEYVAVVLFAVGDGVGARFDDVSITVDLPYPACTPWAEPVRILDGGVPSFHVGVVNESPRNGSEQALNDLAVRAAEVGDLVNLFAHVRWNALTSQPLLHGHQTVLDAAQRVADLGLLRMLTFDFTHADLEGIGDINPLPDGTPVDRLDPAARAAYVAELEALVQTIHPAIVSVGIETDFFLEAHGDEWQDFRTMLCAAGDRLKQADPDLHITTYFTLEGLIRPDLSANVAGQNALRALQPCIDSIGYSYYPADGVRHQEAIPDGLFSAAAEVIPGLPLIVPEFGYRGGDELYPEEEQEAFLRRALTQLETTEVVAAVWFSLYDQTYFGAADFFQDAFRSIGLLHADGTPKRAFAMLAGTQNGARSPLVLHPRPWCQHPPRRPGGRANPADP